MAMDYGAAAAGRCARPRSELLNHGFSNLKTARPIGRPEQNSGCRQPQKINLERIRIWNFPLGFSLSESERGSLGGRDNR